MFDPSAFADNEGSIHLFLNFVRMALNITEYF